MPETTVSSLWVVLEDTVSSFWEALVWTSRHVSLTIDCSGGSVQGVFLSIMVMIVISCFMIPN